MTSGVLGLFGSDGADVQYFQYADNQLSARIVEEEKIQDEDDPNARKDMMHYLLHAKDPQTGEHLVTPVPPPTYSHLIMSSVELFSDFGEGRIALRLVVDPKLTSLSTGKGFNRGQLNADTGLLLGAGADTTAHVLAAMVFYLLRNPRVMEQLVQELQENFTSIDEISAYPGEFFA